MTKPVISLYSLSIYNIIVGLLLLTNFGYILYYAHIASLHLKFLYGGRIGIARGLGKVSMIMLGLIAIPVTKLRSLTLLFGWTFDKTIRIHRLAGWFTLCCIFLHAILLGGDYVISGPGFSFLFSEKGEEMPVKPGTIAGLFYLATFITSLPIIRRKFYGFFFLVLFY